SSNEEMIARLRPEKMPRGYPGVPSPRPRARAFHPPKKSSVAHAGTDIRPNWNKIYKQEPITRASSALEVASVLDNPLRVSARGLGALGEFSTVRAVPGWASTVLHKYSEQSSSYDLALPGRSYFIDQMIGLNFKPRPIRSPLRNFGEGISTCFVAVILFSPL